MSDEGMTGETGIIMIQGRTHQDLALAWRGMIGEAIKQGCVLVQLNPNSLPEGWLDEQVVQERNRLIARGILISNT